MIEKICKHRGVARLRGDPGDDAKRKTEIPGHRNALDRRRRRLHASRFLTNWSKWGATFSGILANGPQSITTWNVALDERGRPNIGPFNCAGLVQIHSKTKEITLTGLYWTLVQYARAFRRGAVIVPSHDPD